MERKKKKKIPVLERIISRIHNKSKEKNSSQTWHTDAHTDGGGGWHSDAWQG